MSPEILILSESVVNSESIRGFLVISESLARCCG